jgi:hypothetical protein
MVAKTEKKEIGQCSVTPTPLSYLVQRFVSETRVSPLAPL